MKKTSSTARANVGGYLFGIDRGGTFTDIVAWAPNGDVRVKKILSNRVNNLEDSAISGIREILALSKGHQIGPDLVEAVCMGTTVGTNALLERQGAPTVFVTTSGFRDALRIGYQNRPKLFDLNIQLPSQLYSSTVEVDERVDVHGSVLVSLNEARVRRDLESAYAMNYRACAIAFMHGYRFPEHEMAVARIAREIGFTQISTSHECSGMIKFVGRAETAVVDAYLTPILSAYKKKLDDALGAVPLFFMQSNGGLIESSQFKGKDCVLSGPAGGIVGAVTTCKAAGIGNVIGFDMGGTSTDVWHYAGHFERTTESQIAGARVRSPIMMIHTVAAGGGSIISFDGRRFKAGPKSAGSVPGPASYRNGGPLTVTDCNVLLGRIPPRHLPNIFGPNGDQLLDEVRPNELFDELTLRVNADATDAKTKYDCAEGFLDIAVENMANAIKKISTERGYDLSKYTLCCFGGAGGQHVCKVAEKLNMSSIFIHPLAGVLSAFGMGIADIRAMEAATVERVFDANEKNWLPSLMAGLEGKAKAKLVSQGVRSADIVVIQRAVVRHKGASSGLEVVFESLATLRQTFEALHEKHYGFGLPHSDVIIESVTIEAAGSHRPAIKAAAAIATATGRGAVAFDRTRMYANGRFQDVPVYKYDQLGLDSEVVGPAIIIDPFSTTVVDVDWRAIKDATGALKIDYVGEARSTSVDPRKADPIHLELFNNRFRSIADQMGHALANSAHSVNIKERLDFSCAIFDKSRDLIANAPHIPIHLGAMSESVDVVAQEFGDSMEAGDLFVLNSPYKGGAHLPDVTVVMPVFNADGSEVLFYTAARGHQADIGGKTPGSLPPDSRDIYEEGALIEPMRLVHKGAFAHDELLRLLTTARYPARNPKQNIIDLQAQVASCIRGGDELKRLILEYSEAVVAAYGGFIQDVSEQELRAIIDQIPEGAFTCKHDMGHHVSVRITVDKEKRSIKVDFTGTSPQVETNFNAPPAIARSATLYVFRTLIDRDIPLNSGCLRPIEVVIPQKSLLSPEHPAAVSSGNPETSVLVTDALYGALDIIGGSQGTMNNFTFGNDTYQYYETICGGAGACSGFDGASAVHTHMTNSLMTDPEVFELRFPVLLEEFSIREGSGGKGQWSGGEGTKRRVRFLAALDMAIVSNRRVIAPAGAKGGDPGAIGEHRVVRADGAITNLISCDATHMNVGDVFEILTPGGGGYGARQD
ncbi:hydantoinase B/oxoprolinase family protein [Bradyrhizobium sp. HKCCYLS2038]|uniref:hydantoinase B/oxoprolinase family protein n=1 Tax=unclassified Bradyrhizobium TaxID=2631580 RepID=UPI003EBCA814